MYMHRYTYRCKAIRNWFCHAFHQFQQLHTHTNTHTHAVAISQTFRLTRISGLKLIKKFSGHATSWRLAVTHENCAVAATAAATAAPVAAAADDDVAVVASIDRIYDCHWKCWNYESPSECVCVCAILMVNVNTRIRIRIWIWMVFTAMAFSLSGSGNLLKTCCRPPINET